MPEKGPDALDWNWRRTVLVGLSELKQDHRRMGLALCPGVLFLLRRVGREWLVQFIVQYELSLLTARQEVRHKGLVLPALGFQDKFQEGESCRFIRGAQVDEHSGRQDTI